MSLATWHFHIEISSKCTLRCPRCARAEVPDTLINSELDLGFFKRNFTEDFIRKNVEKITFCGDDGDPIYAHDLITVIDYIKRIKPVQIVIITNGSHKKLEWWQNLGNVLTSQDTVHFSVDGYDNVSNNLYRVNSDFDSIIVGIETLKATSSCRLVWASIAFKFNEEHISAMKLYANKLGMDAFQLTRSTKFGLVYPSYGTDDPLQPSGKFVSSSHRFERDITILSSRGLHSAVSPTNIKLFKSVKEINNVKPLCEIGNKGLYIDARGRLFPCCWVANRYSHNTEWQTLADQFDLHKRTLSDAIADPLWTGEFKTFRWQECQTKCNQAKVDEKYATEW
jgi:MoaA/NifB/PqqE/SkfB family radical SAM enzyme